MLNLYAHDTLGCAQIPRFLEDENGEPKGVHASMAVCRFLDDEFFLAHVFLCVEISLLDACYPDPSL
jgi:hypothetical protein